MAVVGVLRKLSDLSKKAKGVDEMAQDDEIANIIAVAIQAASITDPTIVPGRISSLHRARSPIKGLRDAGYDIVKRLLDCVGSPAAPVRKTGAHRQSVKASRYQTTRMASVLGVVPIVAR
jgi:hypothetical protein